MKIGAASGRMLSADSGKMPDAQRRILEDIAQRYHGRVPVPLAIWSSAPELAPILLDLAAYLAPQSSLSARETELVILVSAKYWQCDHVWDGHARVARTLGFSDAEIDAIRDDRFPALADRQERRIYDAAMEIQTKRKLDEKNFAALVDSIGHVGICDLTALLGFYAAVAFVLIAYDVPGRP